ncbi:3-hydroxyacyl-ACP dehydratase FabZ [Plasticicumulans lactativorans]|nr:3-hydroxyacyl-ACP dehydratase FabZ [Plasticicumulans lactativorans]
MDISQVLKYLPHRYPFLLIDRVLACEPGVSLTGLKNVTFNEPFFLGHFPQRPVMPGVMILEALAQATGILAFLSSGEMPEEGSTYYFVGIDRARFKQPVGPGDQLLLEVKLLRTKRGIWMFGAEALVDGKVVCSAELMSTKREHGL